MVRDRYTSRVSPWHEPMVGDVIRGLGIEAAKLRGAISAYEYVAPRLSLLERLFLDHAWELIAKRVYPRWLAPNLITLLGGMCVVVAALLSSCWSPSLRGEAPPWIYAANALLLLCCALRTFNPALWICPLSHL